MLVEGGLTGSRSRFPGSLSGELLAGGLPSGRLPGSLLGTGHSDVSEGNFRAGVRWSASGWVVVRSSQP